MALSGSIVWEVRNGGSDSNGGGYKTGASGTDRTLQAAAHATLTAASTVHTTTTQINVAVGDFTVSAADVGNVLQVTGGTATAGFYEITAVDVPNNRWTVDRSVGTAGQTVVGAMGGAFASPAIGAKAVAAGPNFSGMNVFWKYSATPYDVTSTTPQVSGGLVHFPINGTYRLIGYDTTRTRDNTDANRPTLRAVGISSQTLIANGGSSADCIARNFIVDANGNAGIVGASWIPNRGWIDTVRAIGCATGISSSIAYGCHALGGTNGFSGGVVIGSVAEGCSNLGFSGCTIFHCIADTCGTGATTPAGSVTAWNTAYGCTSSGISLGQSAVAVGSVSYGNGAWGFTGVTNSKLVACAGGSNTSGNFNSTVMDAPGFVALTADPFTNAAGGDFSLNTTAGGGAALRAAGFPGPFPNGTTTGYVDIGAAQHEDAGGGAPVFFRRGGLVCKT